jgi:hypothetical protein
VKVLALALADPSQRYTRGYPARGSTLALRPNQEILRLAGFLRPGDGLIYRDQRVEPLDLDESADLVLCHIDLFQEDAGQDLAARAGSRLVFFGRQATAWAAAAPDWARVRVIGDIANVWGALCVEADRLQPVYRATQRPRHIVPDRSLLLNPALTCRTQTIRFAHGCSCPEPVRHLCPEYLYYGEQTLLRPKDEVIGEVVSLPGKRILLLDDDIARWPDYYAELFCSLWDYRREWVVSASERLLDQPGLVRLLAKAGVKAVVFNESLLQGRLAAGPALIRRLRRGVKSIQSARMLAGARIAIVRDEPALGNYRALASLLRRIDLDLISVRSLQRGSSGRFELARAAYHAMLRPNEPAAVVDRFYSIEAILDRLVRRPRRVGFYTTAFYLAPYTMAARQDFFEGLPSL